MLYAVYTVINRKIYKFLGQVKRLKFSEFQYVRPNIKKLGKDFNGLIKKFDSSKNAKEQIEIINEINVLRNNFESMATIVSIKHTINTQDKFYQEEQNAMDEMGPLYQGYVAKYYESLTESSFRKDLEEEFGTQLFKLAEMNVKTFSPEIVEDLQEENKLSNKYTELLASAKINFEGEERNLSQLVPFQTSKDRATRKAAYDARYKFFAENEDAIDNIYDKLVKVRTKIAKKLGFKNFVELGYLRMGRSDYNPEMVASYREQVRKYIVPLSNELRERQRKRLGLDKLMYYDEKLTFKTGNAKPCGDADWIVENGKKFFSELSSETGEYFKFMTDNELLDLVSKKGKAGGGYTTYMPAFKSPFIFSNFNGTSGDIDVLTHESGHAFQCFCSRDYKVPEYYFPTYEACEIHSMSMEFFAWPWMNLFFKDDADKYRFAHLSDALLFVPYGVTVDEFQHYVYENPDATPKDRKHAWREIEKKYTPYKNYDGCDFLERGGFWFQQQHIFNSPFYYIDYTLAQVCAFQFWKKSLEDRKAAWNDYLRLCRKGGSVSFLKLVDYAGLISPFKDECLESVVGAIKTWLDGVDDSKW